jgi:hypothetical protein
MMQPGVPLSPMYDGGGIVKSFFHTTETNLQRDELRLARIVIGRSARFVFLRIPLRVSTKARLLESFHQPCIRSSTTKSR